MMTLTRDSINQRFAEVIQETSDTKVVYWDILGEGPGGWDSNPRYSNSTVNCLVWLQLVISEIYGRGVSDKTAIMDRIRYYGGHVGFSLRKHYIDQWMAFEPEPLVRVNTTGPVSRRTIQLDPKILLADRGFPCGLYRMSETTFVLEYLTGSDLLECTRTLPAGYYIIFAVASDLYIQMYPSNGPMGLVHSAVIRLDELVESERGTKERAWVYHASIRKACVAMDTLKSFVENQTSIHLGYVIYELDPNWEFQRPMPIDDQARLLLECEARIANKRESWEFKMVE